MQARFVSGAGLGLRRGLLAALQEDGASGADFLEVAPENWIGVGGRLGRQLRALSERRPLLCHGLSLNLGGFAPLDLELLRAIKAFLDAHGVLGYSEHLSACADHGQLYDLMPLPFSEESVVRIAERVRIVQDLLERPLIIENVSAYAQLPGELDEASFVCAVLERADCQLLLDVNNLYVNSINFNFDAQAYIAALPSERIAYLHVAGHYDQAADLKIDTHGAPVIDPVWALLAHAYARHGVRPTLLERDFN
ncbi:hypothetical protein N878_18465, partial [Pseudomonas sp. EGD-AK9]|uniref:HvfB family MNIO-type RiPP peptide maturase n=1 Tax=Pseudomonas sp. EGD-AK9 TaxID=1386078 RepID=UPI000396B16B